MEPSDAALVEQCRAGNIEAYGELIRRHQDAVFNLLMKMTANWHEADDLTQEAFIRAYKKLHIYDPRFSFKNWIITIGVNLANNRFRSFLRRNRLERQFADVLNDNTVPSHTASDQRIEILNSALAQLPEKFRIPLVLRHVEGYNYEQIASALGISVSAAKMRVMRGRDALVDRLNSTHQRE